MRTVFFDVDTQIDFMVPAGALAVPGAASIVEKLAALTRFGASHAVQIISTADAHSEDDPEFKIWKPHCVVDTAGQQKLAATSLPKPMILSTAEGSLDPIADQAGAGGQIIIEKQKLDCFSNPNLRLLLDLIQADRFVVYGVASELCVRHAALGLLQTGARVELVKDAIKAVDEEKEREFLEQFQAHSGVVTTTAATIS
jgi:nicotinamidase/pyrazinamidase